MLERISQIVDEAKAAVGAATTSAELEELRIKWLGRKAELPNILRGVKDLDPSERGPAGKAANQARVELEGAIDTKMASFAGAELELRLVEDAVDITLPAHPQQFPGGLHLLTQTMREIEDVFLGLGYGIAEGPEVELVAYNFDALNHAPHHPARSPSDTFYVGDSVLLRTHTSPVQVRTMLVTPPPLYVIAPGRVYRRDDDATHTPQFHQIEGLAVDEGISLADLKGTLLAFAKAIFGDEREIRLRPHFFPFTEPSVEVDVSCFACNEGVSNGERCGLCKGTAWIEILGAGMVDPNVFASVAGEQPAYDPEKVQGFAFGLGIERIAMLKHSVPDLRLLYDNDIRFLEQFA
ncbi:MAG: phenylalanine--tRNA ligase subunit alpha [Actinobacteria bacterium]|uniref:Phenylalanine--tRNA ligase alpha subunit n=1 Tax=freshwater metagenome TaxID=449393 RepID=A0A6J7EGZ6_9ZZZZ|nr:phenylalanine--tRNA ligase subunit alpha [Actinomycetota bacterium]